MRFWDSSAIVPLLVLEGATASRKALLRSDPAMTVWWASGLECASALNRLSREGAMDEAGLTRTLRELSSLAASWFEVQPAEQVRARALRLLRIHPLRAADALQLAAALIAVGEDTGALPFVSDDERLREAAEREGFVVE
jgi:predicted nucleic acid-binding protein